MSELHSGEGEGMRREAAQVERKSEAPPLPDWLSHLAGRYVGEPTARHQTAVRSAAAIRRLIELTSNSVATDDDVELAVGILERAVALLSQGRTDGGGKNTITDPSSVGGEHFLDRSPLIGLENPLSPPMAVQIVRDSDSSWRVVGSATFGSPYEGPPGCVHGGFLAAAFDEVCGLAQSLAGMPAMTVHLEVDYLRPTPLWSVVDFSARVERVEGRKLYTSATSSVRGVDTATAEALFVSVDFDTLRSRRGD